MPRGILIYLILCILLPFTSKCDLKAQDGSFIPTDHWVYKNIERLQNRGLLQELHPTRLPYSIGELRNALLTSESEFQLERRWLRELKNYVGAESSEMGIVAELGVESINGERLDVLRPLGDELNHFSDVHLRGFLQKDGFIAQFGGRHNLYYDEDPDGLDAANRLIARNDQSYLGYQGKWMHIYLGRYKHKWASSSLQGLLLDDNAHSFDHLSFRFGSKSLSISGIYGELDSWSVLNGYTGRAGNRGSGESETPIRRYLAAHRIDWRPNDNIALSFMESSLISGPNAGISLRYLNPLSNFLLMVDNSPKNEENNGLVAGSLWLHGKNTTLEGQILVDDVDLKFGDEPGSVAASGRLSYTGFSFADIGGKFSVVSARSYNSEQAEGQYLYLLRGIATQFSDYVHFGVYSDFFPRFMSSGYMKASLDILSSGDQATIARPFPSDDIGFILAGDNETIIRPSLKLFMRPKSFINLDLDLGINIPGNQAATSRSNTLTSLHDGNSRFVGKFKIALEFHKLGSPQP